MKVEYTIIDPVPNEMPAKLEFRLILNTEDWLLINQYKSNKFRYYFDVNPSDYSNLKTTALNPDSVVSNSPEYLLVCKWGKDDVDEDIFDKDEEIWYSEEYILESPMLKGNQFKKRIDSIIAGIQEIMKSALLGTNEGFDSCWKEITEIDYGNSEVFVEVI